MARWKIPERLKIYGLPGSAWTGSRWLSFAEEGEDAGERRGAFIMLDHGDDPWLFSRSDPWISVGSTNDPTATTERDLARFGLMLLVGSDEQPHYSPLNLEAWMWIGRNRVKPLVEQFDSWERATWQVDGEPIGARLCQFASATVGIATIKSDSVVLVISCGIDHHGLRLERQNDSTQYHFDRAQPMTGESWDRARRAAFGDVLVDIGPPDDFPVETDLIPDPT